MRDAVYGSAGPTERACHHAAALEALAATYAVSTFICTPAAQSQAGGFALGAQVSEATFGELVAAAGFSRFRRATETPLNRVFEARP